MVIFPPKLPKNGVGNNSTFFFLLSLTTIILFIRKYLSQNAMLLVRESFRVVKKNLNRDCCKIREIGRIFCQYLFWFGECLYLCSEITFGVSQNKKGIVMATDIITINPKKRFGKPCVRETRITVYDVLGWLSAGMTYDEILADFPELTQQDILACLAFASKRERALQFA